MKLSTLEKMLWTTSATHFCRWQKSLCEVHETLQNGNTEWDYIPFEVRKELLAQGITRSTFASG